jgi:hypothetical protein
LSANAQQAALKKELEPSRLGKHLSDTLTRRLIIGILMLLMVLPILTYQGYNYTSHSGLRDLFWFGRSSCKVEGTSPSFCRGENWITKEGWEEQLRLFIMSQRNGENSEVEKKLIWLYIPDFNKNGMMSSIRSVPKTSKDVSTRKIVSSSEVFWEEDP